jgi:proteic killer suppression protein
LYISIRTNVCFTGRAEGQEKHSEKRKKIKAQASKKCQNPPGRCESGGWGNPINYTASTLDNCHVIVYSLFMIKTFVDKETQRLFTTGKSKRVPSDLLRRAIRRLEFIHFANDINDLLVPPSNRLHALKGDRKGQYSISINSQWRICFRFIEGDAYDVEITDYH